MNQFVVSARKYRPTSFKEVISQSHITTTLQNAIASGQLAHAFLFCGPRGVGKTTCARILAKTINCLQQEIEPCNECTHCLSFNSNSTMNVYELDAASNNSVEDIRDLVDQVRYGPQVGKYKIYIIDEVHMLSNAAFNAFLKTLEEPPSYALFILATTERHKILPTILSRCQIFNFNSITVEAIVTQLQAIALQESIAYELSALQLIAQKAEGAMRDALSMFDLIATAAAKGGTLTYKLACDHLQHLDYDYYFTSTEAFLKGDIPTLLSLYDRLLRAGFHGHHFVVGLGEHLRNLLVCQDPATLPLLEVPDHIRPQYAAYAAKCTIPFLLRALTRLNQCELNYKASKHPRLHVELLLIELATGPLTDAANLSGASGDAPDNTKKKTVAKSNPDTCVLTPDPRPQPPQIISNKGIKPGAKASIHLPETVAIPTLEDLKNALILKKKSHESAPEHIPNGNTQAPIIAKKVAACLADYRKLLKQKGNIAGYHLINQPINIQGPTIRLSLINPVQEDMLQSFKEDLVTYLREAMHHPDITIQGVLVPQTQNKKPYTDQEKLTYLSKKNAAIALMQERLMLEVAY